MYPKHLIIISLWMSFITSLSYGAQRAPDAGKFSREGPSILETINPHTLLTFEKRNAHIISFIERYLAPRAREAFEFLSPYSQHSQEVTIEGSKKIKKRGVFRSKDYFVGSKYSPDENLHEEGVFSDGKLLRGMKIIQGPNSSLFVRSGIFSGDWHIGINVNTAGGSEKNKIGIFYNEHMLLGFFEGEDGIKASGFSVYGERTIDGNSEMGLFINGHFVFGQLLGSGFRQIGFFVDGKLLFGWERLPNGTIREGLFTRDGIFIHGKTTDQTGVHKKGFFAGMELLDGRIEHPEGGMKVVSHVPYKTDYSIKPITRESANLKAIQDMYFPTHADQVSEFFIELDTTTKALVETVGSYLRPDVSSLSTGKPIIFSPIVGADNTTLKQQTFVPTKDVQGYELSGGRWLRDIGKFMYVKISEEGGSSRWRLALFTMGSNVKKVDEKSLVQAVAAEKEALWIDLGIPGTTGNRGGNLDFTASPVPVFYHGSEVSPELIKFFDSFDRYKDHRVELDTSFLEVGHVDEMLTTVPVRGADGTQTCQMSIIAGSPLLGLELYREYLKQPFDQGGFFSSDAKHMTEKKRMENDSTEWKTLVYQHEEADKKIKENAEYLKMEVMKANPSCGEIKIVFLPQLVKPGKTFPEKLAFKDANAVNLVVLGQKMLVPEPRVPTFKKAIRETLMGLNYRSYFVDTTPLSKGGGEIHCGSNELRGLPRILEHPPIFDAVEVVKDELGSVRDGVLSDDETT